MSFLSKEDKQLSKAASGLPPDPQVWRNTPTIIRPPSNGGRRVANMKPNQTPFSKTRLASNLNGHPSRGSSGNPNSHSSVFSSHTHKRAKTQSTPFSRKEIDLTGDDPEPIPRGQAAADDSDDSLNIGAQEGSRSRIAHDGHATRRLRAERGDAGPSKVAHSDTETDQIEEFPEKPGKVLTLAHRYEARNAAVRPKLELKPGNPLSSLPSKHKPRVKPNDMTPTNFTFGGRGKVIFPLPLADWVRGAQHFAKPRVHFLSWGTEGVGPHLKVQSANGREEFKFNMQRGIEDLEASKNGVSPLIVKFRETSGGSQRAVAFKIDTQDNRCNEPARSALYEFLKGSCGCKGWLDASGARVSWDSVLRDFELAKSESKEPRSSLWEALTDRRSERHSSPSSHQELPVSIKLSPPPEGGKTLQKVERMNRRPTTPEQQETREIVKDEPVPGPSDRPLRRSSRQSTLRSGQPPLDPTRTSPLEDPDELLLVYRPFGTGSVNITRGDLERLQPGKYLNDTLIEFGLKMWLNDLRDRVPELADQIHLFSSFFYKKLAIKDKKAGYESVRKWTSKVDVFSKKYLVVPINEHLHWYLAIVYQPEYTLRPPPLPPTSPVTRKRKREEPSVEPSESRETPTTTSKPTSKAATEIPEGGEMEMIPDSEQLCPDMELEERTQTDEASKPEEREVENQLCVEVSSVSIDDQDEPRIRRGGRDDSANASHVDMEVDNSPPVSPMPVDREVHIEDLTEESTPLGTAEPSIARAEDTTVEPPAVEMEDSFDRDTIPVGGFYGTTTVTRTHGKKPRVSAPGKLENGSPGDSGGGGVELTPLKTDNTYIFIFDSLNGKHPGAMKNLAQYLRFEAMDKKRIENPSSPEATAALVPTQDNYCDCGLYLLHFAKVFMEDPARSFHTILTKRKAPKEDRDVDWKKELVGTSREELTKKILGLSEVWVKERVKEAEEKAKAKEREGTSKPDSIAVDSPEDSDDDVILEEVIAPKQEPKKAASKRQEQTKKGSAGRDKGKPVSKTETETKPSRSAAERFR